MNRQLFIIVMLTLACVLPFVASAQRADTQPESLKNIRVDENLNRQISLELEFTDEQGERVKLSKYFNQGKPVILTMAYYKCPMLCTLVLNGLKDGLNKLTWTAGEKYQLLTISIDPSEGPDLAKGKSAAYVESLQRHVGDDAWAFLTGDEASIAKLADEVGFRYEYDEKIEEYAHPAVAMILTDDGKVSRYLYGISHPANNLRFAMLEADGQSDSSKIATTFEKVLLYCYRYDPDARGYVLFAKNVMQLGGLLVVIGLILFITILSTRDRLRVRNYEEKQKAVKVS